LRMKIEIDTPLGRLTIITDKHYWMFIVAALIDSANELGLSTIPKTVYYGPVKYERLLSLEDFQDLPLVERTRDPVEYWYRDQMLLIYSDQALLSETELKGLIAFELLHHDDNVNQRNITSYALYCASTCDLDYPQVCVDYVKVCMDVLRKVSVASRLSPLYRRPKLMRDLEGAEDAHYEAEVLEDEAQRRLAHLYCLIISTGLSLFGETAERATELRGLSLRAYPEMAEASSFFAKQFKIASERLLDQTFEARFLAHLRKILCNLMHKIAGE